MKQYCQGHSDDGQITQRCQNCQFLDNTNTLNQFPAELKQRIQADMLEIDTIDCHKHHYRYFMFVPF